jgi:GH24 family phage-related lysozyme (muramidase)
MGELPDEAVSVLIEHEGCVPWMYCDRKGLVTVGIGHLLSHSGAAEGLSFVRADGADASADEKLEAWGDVKRYFAPGLTADGYRSVTTLRLSKEMAARVFRVRLLAEFLPGLERRFPGLLAWPRPAQLAVIDMAYSLGLGGLDRYERFGAFLRARNFEGAARECARAGSRPSRNLWTQDTLEKAAIMDRQSIA